MCPCCCEAQHLKCELYGCRNWKSTPSCRPPNQRPLSACCAAAADSVLPNLRYTQPCGKRWQQAAEKEVVRLGNGVRDEQGLPAAMPSPTHVAARMCVLVW